MNQPATPNTDSVANAAQVSSSVKANVEKVLVGKGDVIELCLAAMFSGGHILIELVIQK